MRYCDLEEAVTIISNFSCKMYNLQPPYIAHLLNRKTQGDLKGRAGNEDYGTSVENCNKPDIPNVPEDTFILLPDWEEALFAVGNIIVLVSALGGNIGAMLVLYKSKVTRKSTILFLGSLALCDLLLALTSPTVDLTQLFSRYGGWILGSLLCKMIPMVQTAAVMGVALFLVVIAGERYLTIVRSLDPPNANSNGSSRDPLTIIIMIWILCIVPNWWYYETISFWTVLHDDEGNEIRPRNETCETYYMCIRTTFDERNIVYYSVLGIAALIPTLCFLYFYLSVIVFVRRHVAKLCSSVAVTTMMNTAQAENRIKRSRKTLRLVLCLILLNLCCRLPVWCFVVVTNVKETSITVLTLSLFYGFHLLSNVNSVLNPFVYAIFNDSIRTTHSSHGNTTTNTASDDDDLVNKPNSFKSFFCCCRRWNQQKFVSKHHPFDYFLERRRKQKNYDFTQRTDTDFSISTQTIRITEKA